MPRKHPSTDSPAFISCAQFAERMGLSEAMVRKLTKSGEIRHIKMGDRVLIPADEPEVHLKRATTEFGEARKRAKNAA